MGDLSVMCSKNVVQDIGHSSAEAVMAEKEKREGGREREGALTSGCVHLK